MVGGGGPVMGKRTLATVSIPRSRPHSQHTNKQSNNPEDDVDDGIGLQPCMVVRHPAFPSAQSQLNEARIKVTN
jgi:hypothetical protein